MTLRSLSIYLVPIGAASLAFRGVLEAGLLIHQEILRVSEAVCLIPGNCSSISAGKHMSSHFRSYML